jgi:histidinol-phosphate/aromatic aminotransferase/cobyric acid decarboxylase-like protein
MQPIFTPPISERSARIKRVAIPFEDRSELIRMDRNEDVIGWDEENLAEMLGRIRSSDLAAYHDSDHLEQRIADWIGVLPTNLTVTAGSSEALEMVFEAYVDEGTNVLVLSPSYSLYEVFAAKCGARLIGFPFDSSLNVDVKSLIDAIVREQPRWALYDLIIAIQDRLRELRSYVPQKTWDIAVGALRGRDDQQHKQGVLKLPEKLPIVGS